jgi:sperm-associated antigen 16 protein
LTKVRNCVGLTPCVD